jgi:transposase-like protein
VKKKRFSVEQIVAVLTQAELGMPVADVIRQVGISEQTFYRWKKQYTGMESEQVRELKQLQEENARLKRLVAELSLNKAIPQDINANNGPARAEASGGDLHPGSQSDESAAGLPARGAAPEHGVLPVLQGSQDGAAGADAGACPGVRVRYGYRRLHVPLRREGWSLGKEQAYRLYTEAHLQLCSKRPRRRKMLVTRRERYVPKRANQAWSMDFVADQLVGGTKIRILTIVDVHTREALGTRVGQRLRGEHVVDICNRLVASRGAPVRVFVDNGSEFSGRPLGLWAYHHGVQNDTVCRST